jgi:hypothetical protein
MTKVLEFQKAGLEQTMVSAVVTPAIYQKQNPTSL